MSHILVIAPMQNEADNFNNALDSIKSINTYKVVQVGIGKVNAAVAAALELYDPSSDYDLVAVIGYAAASSIYMQGDLLIPSVVRYHDCSVPPGLVPELTNDYELEGDDDVICLTGDSFVTKELADSLVSIHGKNIIFDMESCAVAQVCDDLNIPLIVMKLISDIPQEQSDNINSFSEFCASHTDFSCFVRLLETLA